MKPIKFGMILCLYISLSTYAQTTNLSIKVIDQETTEPLFGATAYFDEFKLGAITDDEGLAIIENVPLGDQKITISFFGYKTIHQNLLVTNSTPITTYVMVHESLALDGVVVQFTRSTRTIQRIPTRLEYIGLEELGEKALMNAANISLVLRESTGIQIQQTSLSSASSSIRIQGLDGRYTQLLKDGFPLFSGFSGGLSINQIPPLDINQFEIIKGSSSTLYGGGAIAGLVNLVSKTPTEKPKMDIQLSQTHSGGKTTNIFYSNRKNNFGYTLYSSGHLQRLYDPDNDDFSNLPQTNTISIHPKFFFYPSEKEYFWLGVNTTFDKRKGGDVKAILGGVDGIHQYFEENLSRRISSQAVYKKYIHDTATLEIKNSLSYFDRELTTPKVLFSGRQLDVFSEINYALNKDKNDWIFGINFYQNSFVEDRKTSPRNQHSMSFGAFVNNIRDFSEKVIVESGFRTDFVPTWGIFPLPRISLLWNLNPHFSSRIGGGLGYKIPDMFTEEAATLNFENVLPLDQDFLNAERSYGANIDLNFTTRIQDKVGLSFNQLVYLTSIDDALLLTQQSDGFYLFNNAIGSVLSKGAETNIKVTFNDFRWFVNYAFNKTTLNYLPNNPQKALTPNHQAGNVIMYENDKWRIGYETYYTGIQTLGSGKQTKSFLTMGLLVQKHFSWGSSYLNFENFTDRRQSRFSAETLPPHQNPQFAEIYAPTNGFEFTVGVILNPFGGERHH